MSTSYGDPFHLEVKYSEADFEFLIDFNHGDDTTTYTLATQIPEVLLKEIKGVGGMEVNFVGVSHEGKL